MRLVSCPTLTTQQRTLAVLKLQPHSARVLDVVDVFSIAANHEPHKRLGHMHLGP